MSNILTFKKHCCCTFTIEQLKSEKSFSVRLFLLKFLWCRVPIRKIGQLWPPEWPLGPRDEHRTGESALQPLVLYQKKGTKQVRVRNFENVSTFPAALYPSFCYIMPHHHQYHVHQSHHVHKMAKSSVLLKVTVNNVLSDFCVLIFVWQGRPKILNWAKLHNGCRGYAS